jgi:hypothetical protein
VKGAVTAGIVLVLILIIVVALVGLVAGESERARHYVELLQHLSITFLVVWIFHAIESVYAEGKISERFKDLEERFETHTTQQRQQLETHANEFRSLLDQLVPFGLTTKQLGLVNVYSSREQAMTAVRERMGKAKDRIQMLGVAFKEQLEVTPNATGITDDLKRFLERKKGGEDLRILVLHPMTSPAVFRAFLETPANRVGQILKFHSQDGNGNNSECSYFDTQLFSDCNQTRLNLRDNNLAHSVKYYQRDPTLWMIMLDDEVFVESYTFGRSDLQLGAQGTLRLGGHMPVLHFKGADTTPYKILDDHFSRLWDTSTDTVEELDKLVQPQTRNETIRDRVFAHRHAWLTKVQEALAKRDVTQKSAKAHN